MGLSKFVHEVFTKTNALKLIALALSLGTVIIVNII